MASLGVLSTPASKPAITKAGALAGGVLSVGAQVRRAYDLQLLDAAQYQRAYKYIAAQGWLKGEPDELGVEEPELIPLAFDEMLRLYRTSPLNVCARLRSRPPVFERVAGIALPPQPPDDHGGQVIQLELVWAEKQQG